MFTEPLTLTIDAVDVDFKASAMRKRGESHRLIFQRHYSGDVPGYEILISHFELPEKRKKVEILLTCVPQDPDSDPFNGDFVELPNSFGFVYVFNDLEYETFVAIPDLRAALSAFVDSGLQTRLINGES